MRADSRKHPRFRTTLPTRFNLNPDHHVVPEIRKWGVKGAVNNISCEGLQIDSHMDLCDVCQIFSEAMDDDSAFELEVELIDAKKRSTRVRGEVKWYRVSEPDKPDRHFQAGLRLRDAESQAVAMDIVESITASEPN